MREGKAVGEGFVTVTMVLCLFNVTVCVILRVSLCYGGVHLCVLLCRLGAGIVCSQCYVCVMFVCYV